MLSKFRRHIEEQRMSHTMARGDMPRHHQRAPSASTSAYLKPAPLIMKPNGLATSRPDKINPISVGRLPDTVEKDGHMGLGEKAPDQLRTKSSNAPREKIPLRPLNAPVPRNAAPVRMGGSFPRSPTQPSIEPLETDIRYNLPLASQSAHEFACPKQHQLPPITISQRLSVSNLVNHSSDNAHSRINRREFQDAREAAISGSRHKCNSMLPKDSCNNFRSKSRSRGSSNSSQLSALRHQNQLDTLAKLGGGSEVTAPFTRRLHKQLEMLSQLENREMAVPADARSTRSYPSDSSFLDVDTEEDDDSERSTSPNDSSVQLDAAPSGFADNDSRRSSVSTVASKTSNAADSCYWSTSSRPGSYSVSPPPNANKQPSNETTSTAQRTAKHSLPPKISLSSLTTSERPVKLPRPARLESMTDSLLADWIDRSDFGRNFNTPKPQTENEDRESGQRTRDDRKTSHHDHYPSTNILTVEEDPGYTQYFAGLAKMLEQHERVITATPFLALSKNRDGRPTYVPFKSSRSPRLK
ncbi:hypothetical protein DFH28DRAFT_952179 [Melampsora americana]|nr:hypothetical protein DFH28DRAFT_952179 [Melampsora americana]